MQVFRGIPSVCASPCVLTIGNFDGVHRGHQALLQQLNARAKALGLPSAVLTFEPLPREFFARKPGAPSAPARLSNLRQKLENLAAAGVERVYVQAFNAQFADLSAHDFIARLAAGTQARHVLIGDDFRFGRGRQGDFTLLQQAGAAHGFTVEALHTVHLDDERVSSSAVRRALMSSEFSHAEALLGAPYTLSGRVLHGRKLGRTLGFPTVNIQLKQRSLPLRGIFAVEVSGAGLSRQTGAASIGVRPTLGDALALWLEVHLLDFSGDLYDQRLSVRFCHKIRDEAKFDSLAALTLAIQQDCDQIKQWFATQRAANTFATNSLLI